jgi:hypothetical protein
VEEPQAGLAIRLFKISNNQYPISNDQVCYLHLDIDHSLLDIGYSLFPLGFSILEFPDDMNFVLQVSTVSR